MQATGLTSLNQLATRINATRQTVYFWRDGISQAGEEYALALAELANTDPAPWIAEIKADSATSEQARRFWHATAARLAA